MSQELMAEVIAELEAVERLVRRNFPAFKHPLLAKMREALAEPQQFVPDWATYRQGFEDGKAEAIEAAPTELDIFSQPCRCEKETKGWCVANSCHKAGLAQPALNLQCKSEQARLATLWGYVKSQPAHEPVAYLWQHGETGRTRIVMPDQIITANANWSVVGPLYLSPPQRQPLTDEQIEALAYKHLDVGDGLRGHHFVTGDIAFARAIEQAHGIKKQS